MRAVCCECSCGVRSEVLACYLVSLSRHWSLGCFLVGWVPRFFFFFFSSRRRHTRFDCDWSSDVCSSDLRLASTADYPKKSEVIPLKNEVMARLNKVGFTLEAGVSIVDFVENKYFPSIEIGRASCRERV